MFRFIAAAALGLALAAAPAAAQQYGAPLRVAAGEQYSVSMDITESIVAAGQDVSVGATMVYRLDILSATPDDRRWLYTPVEFNYTDVSMLGAGLENSGMDFALLGEGLSALVRVAADIGFECRVDAYGRCLEWSNWPQWSARAENLVLMGDAFGRMAYVLSSHSTAAEEEGQGKARTEQQRAAAARPQQGSTEIEVETPQPAVDWMAMREPVLRSVAAFLDGIDARSAALAMGSLHPLAAVQGRRMARGAPEAFVEEWDMPFEAPPLRVAGTLVLDSVNQRANTATFTRHAMLDAESASASMQGVADYMINTVLAPMQPFLDQQGADVQTMSGMVEAMLPQLSVEMTESTTGIVDLTTGMARETTTDYVIMLRGPGAAEAPPGEDAVTVRVHYVIRVAPGAPPVPRLPRGN